MTYFKSITIGILLSLMLCLTYGCGSSTVIPDPYIPEDYGFTGDVSTTPFESVKPKFVENELTYITWATQEDVDNYYTDFVGTLFFLNQEPVETRKIVIFQKPLSMTAESVSLVQAAMIFKPQIFEVYSDGAKYYDEPAEFTHLDISSGMSIFNVETGKDVEFDNDYLLTYPHYGSSKTFNFALSDAEVAYFNNSALTEESAVASYDFENTKDITAVDSINGLNGTLKGSLKVQSSDTNSFPVFRKDGDYLEVPHNDSISFEKEFSVSFWIYPDYSVSTNMEIMDKGKNSNDNYELFLNKGVLSFQYKDAISGKARSITNSELSLKAHEWVHIGISLSSASIAFYKNGVKSYEEITPLSLVTNTDPLFIGRKNQSRSQRNFYGAMDQIIFYNRALTSSEFEAIYNMQFIK